MGGKNYLLRTNNELKQLSNAKLRHMVSTSTTMKNCGVFKAPLTSIKHGHFRQLYMVYHYTQ